MRKTKLPKLAKKVNKCKSCGAAIIHSYDNDNEVYKWKCQGCGATRYEPAAKFETKFTTAAEI